MDYIIHGVLQARILEWVALPFSRGSSQPRVQTQVSCIAGRFFTSWATREAPVISVIWMWSCSVVSDSLPSHLPTRLVCPWNFQARVLEWVAISFSRASSWSRGWTQVSHLTGTCLTVWASRKVPVISVIYTPVSILFRLFSHLDCYVILNRYGRSLLVIHFDYSVCICHPQTP